MPLLLLLRRRPALLTLQRVQLESWKACRQQQMPLSRQLVVLPLPAQLTAVQAPPQQSQLMARQRLWPAQQASLPTRGRRDGTLQKQYVSLELAGLPQPQRLTLARQRFSWPRNWMQSQLMMQVSGQPAVLRAAACRQGP